MTWCDVMSQRKNQTKKRCSSQVNRRCSLLLSKNKPNKIIIYHMQYDMIWHDLIWHDVRNEKNKQNKQKQGAPHKWTDAGWRLLQARDDPRRLCIPAIERRQRGVRIYRNLTFTWVFFRPLSAEVMNENNAYTYRSRQTGRQSISHFWEGDMY